MSRRREDNEEAQDGLSMRDGVTKTVVDDCREGGASWSPDDARRPEERANGAARAAHGD
jgi:hypothetical protein